MLFYQWIKHQIHFTLTYFIKLLVHFHPPLQEIRHSISGCAVTHGITCYWSPVLLVAEIWIDLVISKTFEMTDLHKLNFPFFEILECGNKTTVLNNYWIGLKKETILYRGPRLA